MDILALGLRDRACLEPLGRDCPVIKAEVIYAVEEEMAMTLDDFMGRRTSLMHFDEEQGLPVIETVAKIMRARLGWKRDRLTAEIRKYRQAVGEGVGKGSAL